ncbi:MAG: HAD family phosphatase [Gemmatimonadales bacterium]
MRGVCFDFNGVIVDDERHHCLAVISTLAEHGIVLDRAGYYRDYLGFDDEGCFRYAWQGARLQLDQRLLEELVAQKGQRYRALLDADLTLVPGIQGFVGTLLEAGSRLVVVSAARRWEIDHVLAIAGLSDAFVGIVSAEDVGRTKPDPEGYLRGLTLLQLPATSCVVIEDSLPGLAAGRSAGMRVAMLTTSHSRDTLGREAPDVIWADYSGRTAEELPWNPSSS